MDLSNSAVLKKFGKNFDTIEGIYLATPDRTYSLRPKAEPEKWFEAISRACATHRNYHNDILKSWSFRVLSLHNTEWDEKHALIGVRCFYSRSANETGKE